MSGPRFHVSPRALEVACRRYIGRQDDPWAECERCAWPRGAHGAQTDDSQLPLELGVRSRPKAGPGGSSSGGQGRLV